MFYALYSTIFKWQIALFAGIEKYLLGRATDGSEWIVDSTECINQMFSQVASGTSGMIIDQEKL